MDVFLTLDYELFLGSYSGSVQKCLIEPMSRLQEIALTNSVRYTIFVDTTYLIRLRELKNNYEKLQKDYDVVIENLRELSKQGHDLQLHIHPQWAFSVFDGDKWQIDSTHYKLSDIPEEMARNMFAEGVRLLEEISGKRPVAFRAGGFSAQPTNLTANLMKQNSLMVDSSVYPGTCYNTAQQQYDYRNAPEGRIYSYDRDMSEEAKDGSLKELPLSTYNVSPLYFWGLIIQRLTKQKKHRRIGDGASVKTANSSILKRLTTFAKIHATIDESKISFLRSAYKRAKRLGHQTFCVIGHPKLATEYSLHRLPGVIEELKNDGAAFKTVSQIIER